MNRRWLLGWIGMTVIVALAPLQAAETPVTGFLNRTVTVEGKEHPYVVYLPRDYTPERKWPVILFLHGAGERGTDGLKQSQVGIGTALRFFPERFPAVVVMPQCLPGERWADGMADVALKALDDTIQRYQGDPNRIYLTGLSMGGAGSWYLGTAHPQRFAAIVSICGRGDIPGIVTALKDKPVWIVVGDQDQAQTVQFAREVHQALKSGGSTTVRYTEYPGVGHNSWDKAYAEPELATWLFAQRLKTDG